MTATALSCRSQAVILTTQNMSPIPIQPGGRKTPPFPWKKHQTTRATISEVNQWYENHPEWGVAVITGAISGNLEMIELEGRAQHHEQTLTDQANEMGITSLWERIQNGWKEQTPSGGIHWYYRVQGTPVLKNTKLARTKDHVVLAETRGEGGLSVIAPTGGNCHTSGKPWETLAGGPLHVPTITAEEYTQLHQLFATLDETPAQQKTTPTQHPTTSITIDSVRPGDDIENKITWAEILTPHGWQIHSTKDNETFWTRPGKHPRDGHSASTGHAGDRDRLYVWSSSTPFPQETPITKFRALSILNHGGDDNACAKTLANQGYGTPAQKIIWDIPRRENTPTTQHEKTTSNEETTLARLEPGTSLKNSEDYDALTFVEQHATEICYCPERASWYHWNGHKWEQQAPGGGILRELMRQYGRKLPQETKTEIEHKKRATSNSGVTNRLALASTDQRIVTPQTNFDNHPYELNTPETTINLKTGEQQPNNPLKYHTRATTLTPKRIPTPMWDRFLNQTFANSEEMIQFMQRLVGYSATGEVTHHILPFLYGPGGNGKSVFLDLIIRILGDYATSTPAGFLMAGKQKHETEVAQLSGARFAVSSEVNENDRFDEAKVKLLTGGDTLKARFMYKDFFNFKPTHTLWLMGNHQPRVQSGGTSFWRRLLLIGFTNTIRDEDRIEGLTELLYEQEGAGILQWIIDGAVACHHNGLNPPEQVKTASREYAAEEDTLARFIEDNVIIGGGESVRVNTAEMRRRYAIWCDENGHREMSAQAFGRELKNRFKINQTRSHGKRYYTNVTLTASDLDSEENTASWYDLGE